MSALIPLTTDDIRRLALLTRIELTPTDALCAQAELNNFFTMVEQLQAVDTANIEPLCHPIAAIEEMTLRLREDVVTEDVVTKADQREANMANAPMQENGLFLVPKVLE